MPDHSNPNVQRQRWIGRYLTPWIVIPVLLLLLPLLLPLLLVRIFARLIWSGLLCGAAWTQHAKLVIFVYSDSPKWKEHIESHILPDLPPDAIIINRSQPWDQTALTGRIFRHFGGHHEFCPIGIVVERWRSIRLFRLFKPFQEARHGDCSALNNVQAAMLAATQNGR